MGYFKKSSTAPLFLFLVMDWSIFACAQDNIWFVDKNNLSGVEDGQSWATAFTTLQPALDGASETGGGEVWVANGVYDQNRSSIIDIDPHEDSEILVETGSLVLSFRKGL